MTEDLNIGDLIILEPNTPANKILLVITKVAMRRFECTSEASNKFWEIWLSKEKIYITRWGVIGTEGQSSAKPWNDSVEAKREHDKIIKEKLKKGYKEISPDENHFIYSFKNPGNGKPGGFISSFDVVPWLKKYNGKIQRTQKV